MSAAKATESAASATCGQLSAVESGKSQFFVVPPAKLNKAVIDCSDLTPHVPFLYYGHRQKQDGVLSVYINTHRGSNDPVPVQLCDLQQPLRAPFGLVEPGSKESAHVIGTPKNRWNLDLALPPESAAHALAQAIDEKTVQMAVENFRTYFPMADMPSTKEEVEAEVRRFYRPLLTIPNDSSYPPTMRAKVVLEGTEATHIMVKKGMNADGSMRCREGNWRDLQKKRIEVLPVAKLTGLWIMSGAGRGSAMYSFGVNVVLTTVLLMPTAPTDHVQPTILGITVELLPPKKRKVEVHHSGTDEQEVVSKQSSGEESE